MERASSWSVRGLALAVLCALVLVALGGVALAKNITGTDRADRLVGTPKMDQIYGLGGPDYVAGKQGADEIYGGRGVDELYGGAGSDALYGGRGNDTISAAGTYRDTVNCGPGTDTAYVDERDRVFRECENINPSHHAPHRGR
jgi:Ca2+-binding RTX toxin-like protein